MTADLPEEELVRRFREGDAEALCALFDRYEASLRNRVERYLSPRLRRRHSVSDVLQESRVVAFERREDFEPRGEGSLRAWLLSIVERKTKRAVQRHQAVAMRSAGREVTKPGRADTEQFEGAGPSPSEVAAGAEIEAHARAALRTLPEDHQELLRLFWLEDVNLREAALRMGRSYAATKKLYGRALARFGRELRRLRGGTHG